MYKIQYAVALLAIFVIFFFEGPLVDILGWSYVSSSSSAFTKIHPSTYIFAIAAFLTVLNCLRIGKRFNPVLRSWQFLFFCAAVAALILQSFMIATSRGSAGEQSIAITTYGTVILVVIAMIDLRFSQLAKIAFLIRLFFIINSIMAVVEVLRGANFFVGYVLESGLQGRATALTAHPLSGAALTGLMVILLTFGPRRSTTRAFGIAELGLHGIAMFAFGGRAALVMLIAMLVAGGVVVRRKTGEDKVGIGQRITPYLILTAGAFLVLFPPDFMTKALDRFDFAADKSAQTRFVLIDLMRSFNTSQLLWGAERRYLDFLFNSFRTPLGIEVAWLQLTAVFGLLVALPLLVSLVLLLLRLMPRLDRAALLAAVYFLLVTACSLSIGSKSLLVSQCMIMLLAIADRSWVGQLHSSKRTTNRHRINMRGQRPHANGPARFVPPA